MSSLDSDSNDENMTQFTGFNVTQKGKDRLEYMAKFFLERGMITEQSYAGAARKCLDIGWTIVSAVVEAEAEGKTVDSVTIPLGQPKQKSFTAIPQQ